MNKPKLWYLIAVGGRARFVERDEQGAYRTVVSFVAAERANSLNDNCKTTSAAIRVFRLRISHQLRLRINHPSAAHKLRKLFA